ncbi:MAG: ABC transporter permease [Candidatus Gastranaerophilales bacterium]
MIEIKSILNMALISLKVNKMRSVLTSLGVIIGVSAVIIMLAVGNGSSQKIAEEMESLGSNLLIVRAGSAKTGGVKMGSGTMPTLTLKDAVAIEKTVTGVMVVAPYSSQSAQVTFGNQNWSTSVGATNQFYTFVRDYDVASGRNISEDDLNNNSNVVVMGNTVAVELFGDMDPVGKTVRISNVPFKVVGLLESKGQNSMGHDQDDLVFIPVTTAQKKVFGTDFPGTISSIVVKALSDEIINTTEEEIISLLRVRHKIGSKEDDDFEVKNLAETQEMIKSTANTMSILLGAIASVSLIVGGIGIMNIMLVSVTERTREIGIRMAIGAKQFDIRIQFLFESFILSVSGGIIGVLIGIVAAHLIHYFSGASIIISSFSVILSLSFSGIIGIVFGYYPAYKASLLNPIDALRYE